MSEPWVDHVVTEIRKSDRQPGRLLEITTQLIYLENIDMIPEPVADQLMGEIRKTNNPSVKPRR